jgi:carboxyl-terminal processing protease
VGGVVVLISVLRAPVPAKSGAAQGTRLFENVLAHVRQFAVDSLNDQEIYRRAAAGVIDELDDPDAELILPGEHEVPVREATPQGLHLDKRDGGVVIVASVPGSPADSAGVRPGDRLLSVDSTRVDPTRFASVPGLLEGRAGSTVALRVRRDSSRTTIELKLVRGAFQWPAAVATAEWSDHVGRVRVSRVVPGLADSVRAALNALQRAGVRAVALDLRGLVGGGLEDGAAVAELFLAAGKTVARSRARPASDSRRINGTATGEFATLPLAVLVNGGSSGAAEVIAGALQDHDRAAILGSSTFGRGVTQSVFPLGNGASLRLTTAFWETPLGRQIQRPPRPATGDSLPPRPRFKSDGGRILLGGGGITPDRMVAESGPDDLVLAEARNLLSRAATAAAVLALVADTSAH